MSRRSQRGALSFRASDRVTGAGIRLFGLGRTDCRVASLLAMTMISQDANKQRRFPGAACLLFWLLRFLHAFQQFLRGDAEEPGQGQQVGGTGLGGARFPYLKILVMYECLHLLA